jgi:hypothetical protein
MATLLVLPDECLVRVASLLPVTAVAALRATCRRLRRVGSDRLLWQWLCVRDGMVVADDDPVHRRGGHGSTDAPGIAAERRDWAALYRERSALDAAWVRGGYMRAPQRVRGLPVSSVAIDIAHGPPRLFLGLAHGQVLMQALPPGPDEDRGKMDVITVHAGSVSALVVVDALLVTASFDGTVRLLALDGEPGVPPCVGALPALGASVEGRAVAAVGVHRVGERGTLVVTVGRMDGALAVSDAATARVLQWVPDAHAGWLACLHVDGDRMVTGGQDGLLKVWRWRTDGGAPLDDDGSSGRWPHMFSSLPGGTNDGPVTAADAGGWVLHATLAAHSATVMAVQLRGEIAVAGSYDHTVSVWHVGRGQLLHRLVGHLDHVNGVAMADRWQLVSCSEDGSLVLWNWRTGTRVRSLLMAPTLTASASVDCVCLAGAYLVAGTSDGFVTEYAFTATRPAAVAAAAATAAAPMQAAALTAPVPLQAADARAIADADSGEGMVEG